MNVEPLLEILSAVPLGAIFHDIPNRICNDRHKRKVEECEGQTCPVPSGRPKTVQYRPVFHQVADRSGDSESIQAGKNENARLEKAGKVTRQHFLYFILVLRPDKHRQIPVLIPCKDQCGGACEEWSDTEEL